LGGKLGESEKVSEEIALKGGLTYRSLALIIIYTVLFVPINAYANQVAGGSAMIGSPLGVLFLLSLAGLASKALRLTPQEATVFWPSVAVGAGGSFWIMYWGWMECPLGLAFRYPPESEIIRKSLPSFLFPTPEAFSAMWAGGATVNWSLWIGPLLFFLLASLSWAFTGLFLAIIIRKQLIEVEKLPFPAGMLIGHSVLALTAYEEEKPPRVFSWTRGKWFLIGAVIGTLVYVPTVLVADWFPSFWPSLGISIPFAGQFSLGATLNTLLADLRKWAPVDTGLFFVPGMIGIAYLAPLDVTLTIWLFFFILKWIWPIIGYGSGIIPQGQDYWNMTRWGGPNLGWIIGDGAGIWYGIALYWLAANYKPLAQSLKAAIGGTSPEERVAWAGLGISLLLVLITMLIMQVPFIMALIIVILFVVAQIVWAKGLGEGYIGSVSGARPLWSWMYQTTDFGRYIGIFPAPSGTTENFSVPAFMTSVATWAYMGHLYQSPNRAGDFLAHFTAAKITLTRIKDIVIGIIITVLIGYTLGAIFTTASMHAKGGANLGGYAFSPGFFAHWRSYGLIGSVNPTESMTAPTGLAAYYAHFVAGIILAVVIYMLRARYTWFFVNPIGLTMAPIAFFVLPAFIGWACKYITIKLGGTKAYNEIGIPIVIGYYIATSLIGGFIDPFGIFAMRAGEFKLGGF